MRHAMRPTRRYLWPALVLCLLWAGTAQAVPRGENLLANPGLEEPGVWTVYGSGFVVDNAVHHSGRGALRLDGESSASNAGTLQRLEFDPPLAGPLRVSGWSKAQDAELSSGSDCGPYLDLMYADGTPLWGQRLAFSGGTHDWHYREAVIEPEKPVKSILFHVLLRRARGSVWFDDLRLELLPLEMAPGLRAQTARRGGEVSLRATANMPCEWTMRVRQEGRDYEPVAGKGREFAGVTAGLRPGLAQVHLEASDLYRGDRRQWQQTIGVPPGPARAWATFAPISGDLSQHGTPGRREMEAELSGLRGESESLQINLCSAFEADSVDVALTDLVGPQGTRISKSAMRLYRLGEVQGHPDTLLPYGRLHLQPWKTTPLWLTVQVPREARPGRYEGQLLLSTGDQTPEPEPLMLTVWDAQMPERPSLPAVVGIGDAMFSTMYGLKEGTPEWSAALAEWYALLKSYRVSPYFCRFGQQEPNHYAYPAPWPIGDPRADPYLNAPDLAAFAVEYPLGGDEARLRRSLEYLKAKGWLERGFFYLWDEPNQMAQYERIRQWAGKIRAIAPEARILTTYYCGPTDGPQKDNMDAVPQLLRGATDIFCTSQWAAHGSDSFGSRMKLRGTEQWWLYVCCGPGYPEPNLYLGGPENAQRAVIWRLYTQGARGFLYWCANAFDWQTKPEQPVVFRRGVPAGDGVLLYPGEAFGVKGPVASARLARLREGLEDYEYLNAHAAKWGPEATRKLLSDVYPATPFYTRSGVEVGDWREGIAVRMDWVN